MKKVYCAYCKYLKINNDNDYECLNKNTKHNRNSWYCEDDFLVKHPKTINNNNDCKYYEDISE